MSRVLPGNKVQMTIYMDKAVAEAAVATAKADDRTFNSWACQQIKAGLAATATTDAAHPTTTNNSKKG